MNFEQSIISYINAIPSQLFLVRKRVYQELKFHSNDESVVLFIVGCQRSGTSLINRIFQRDWNARVYPERSRLSPLTSLDREKHLRLNPLPDVKRIIERNRAPLVVAKPLVESQHIVTLLDNIESARALWMYRNYRGVALSNMKKFDTNAGIRNLLPIVERQEGNWRSENVSDEVRSVVLKFFSTDMDPYDASALFWWVRNRLFFELNLADDPRVRMCRYEDLVTDPKPMMHGIHDFLGVTYPGDQVFTEVHSASKTKGQEIKLSPKIEGICEALLTELDDAYFTRGARLAS